jgi:hypothetical protein
MAALGVERNFVPKLRGEWVNLLGGDMVGVAKGCAMSWFIAINQRNLQAIMLQPQRTSKPDDARADNSDAG